jgi:cysteine sulfinate desulfinase/cysteine desulfurase-like protein
MGVPLELSRGAIRVSLGYLTSEGDIGTFLKAWEKLAKGLYIRAGNSGNSPLEAVLRG